MAKIDDSVKKKVPELRFPGFTDDWEERKLGELSNIVGGGTPSTSNPEYWDGDIDWYAPAEIGEQSYVSKSKKTITELGLKKSSARILPVGTVLFTSRAGIGSTAILAKEATTNQGFQSIVPDQNKLDSYFIFSRTNELKRYGEVTGAGSTFVEVSGKQMSKMSIMVPELSEQQKIGSFFKQLDDTIALHQRKLDLLKEQKKGYLQKMFPKNGAKVPELRFAGFADDWEERKLSDVANHRGGTAIEKYFDKYGVYKVISIGSYGLNSQYVDQNIRAISNEITDGRVVNSGELTMVLNDKTANGTIIGRTLLVEKDNEYVINQRTEIISPKENFDSNFAYTILNGPFREKVKRIVQGGTQIYVNYPAVSNLNLELPKIEEQQKIGSFFKQLDDTIALHQRKLDLLKEQKKGFLQKMFV
ncbi:MAG: restriction endonuclease subunit S [Lactococcus lactis]|nr:restriction endonuclease subunit S [Lactococcus lactis]MDN6164123.1 restriction endonuclease subunit S [Tetragenococcus halophilus]MDN6718746.1 restriction endonuclease subunit S [Lactococcus lactis]